MNNAFFQIGYSVVFQVYMLKHSRVCFTNIYRQKYALHFLVLFSDLEAKVNELKYPQRLDR